jgi:hydroxypyruvate isomerase
MKNDNDTMSVGNSRCTRRTALCNAARVAALGAAWPLLSASPSWSAVSNGRIKQSVCLWCYDDFMKKSNMDLDQFAAACAKIGLKSIELATPDLWPTLKKHGLICAMTPSHSITKGINHLENHEECLAKVRKSIDANADAGFPNVITLSGNRAGMDDQEGLENSVIALKKIAPYAEQKKVTVCLEFLNSIDHKDYMADSTKWCVELVHKVGSPRVKILYDIYHAAMMKEDVFADIRQHADCFGHYHTGGMPGRHEIDSTQTLDYPKIVQAILDTGYTGYLGQEFIPAKPEALKSLERAVEICDIHQKPLGNV